MNDAAVSRWRIAAVFGVLGCASVLVLLRLVWLQLDREAVALSMRAAERQHERYEWISAPRATILARDGERLAFDRPVFELRAELALTADNAAAHADEPRVFERVAARVVERLVWAIGRDPAHAGDHRRLDEARRRLVARIDRALARPRDPRASTTRVDILIDPACDSAAVVSALRGLEARRRHGDAATDHEFSGVAMTLHVRRRFERVHPLGEAAEGLVGSVREGTLPGKTDAWGEVAHDRFGVNGLERLRMVTPRDRGRREYRVTAVGERLWSAAIDDVAPPIEIVTTIDSRLQAAADSLLREAVGAVTEQYESAPEWGAMVLVDVASGGVLALASHACGKDGRPARGGAFAPTQRLFEPGSIVKPLQLALGLERGVFDWNAELDCSAGYTAGQDQADGRRLPRRTIVDTHSNGMLTPRGVLVHSSNIGAVRLGLRLGPDGLDDYLRLYEYGVATDLPLPGERIGSRPASIATSTRNEQLVYAGPSVCFGYQLRVTPVQIARAFLTMVSGRQRTLKLIAGVRADGRFHAQPYPAESEQRFLSPATVKTITEALVAVAHGEDGSTARLLAKWLDDHDVPYGLFAGKTGTSEYSGRLRLPDGRAYEGMIRTASFVGYAPASDPRFLVVCVLQKAGAGSFFGGRYAAPAAGRLLHTALMPDQETFLVVDGDRSGSEWPPRSGVGRPR